MESKTIGTKPIISQSRLTMYERCGEQYRRRYLENEKIPPGVAMLKGIGVHDSSRANFRQKIETRKDLPKQDIVDMAVSQYDFRVKQGILLNPDEEKIGYDNVVGAARDGVVTLSTLYADAMAPIYQPIMVEAKQVVETGSSHDLMAFMDLADDKNRVIDLKTSKRKKQVNAADIDEQLTFYALVYRYKFGQLPSEVRLETLVEKKKPERQLLQSKRTVADLQVIINRLNAMIAGIKKGVFIPALATSWQCDPRYCGYYMTCPYVKK